MPSRTDTIKRTEDLKRLLFNAQFEDARKLIAAVSPVSLPCLDKSAHDGGELLFNLKFRSMAAEVADYWGDFALAEHFIEQPATEYEKSVYDLLEKPNSISLTNAERLLLRQKVWVLIQWGMSNYRKGALEDAFRLFSLCDDACARYVVTSSDMAWGTRARLQYCLGLVFRERFELDVAASHFTNSAELAYRSLEKSGIQPSKLAYVAIAKSLALGLAFIHNVSGRPDLAKPLLVAAKSMLQPIAETMISAYVDLLYANVQRGIEGSASGTIDDVISRLEACHKTFSKAGHRLYTARAAYGLAVAHLQRARPDESIPLSKFGAKDLAAAEKYCEQIKSIGQDSRNPRLEFYRSVLKSRINRKRGSFKEAEEFATKVIQGSTKNDSVRLDSLLARAEARFMGGNIVGAETDFNEALKATRNPRIRSLCLLHLGRIQVRLGNLQNAMRLLQEFDKLKVVVANAQVQKLEARVREEVEGHDRDLIIRMTDADINVSEIETRVRRFLVDWAKSRASSDSEAAKVLGISRQTFYNWCEPGKRAD